MVATRQKKITLDNSILVLGFSLGKVSAVLISASILVCEWLGGHLLLVVGGRGVIGGGGRCVGGRGVGCGGVGRSSMVRGGVVKRGRVVGTCMLLVLNE